MKKSAKRTADEALQRIYNLSLDNITLQAHRRYMLDVYTYGIGVIKMSTVDEKARHCAIHGCPSCKRRVDFELGKQQARARLILVLACLALLVAVYCMGRNS